MKLYAVASVALLVSAACGQAFVLVAVVLGLMLMAARPARAAEYVLSPDGDDSAAGNREHPWRTVGRANTSLQPGDTAVFLTGEYEGGLSPKRNGTKDAPIVYRSAEPWGARLVMG
jgi:hypothetical protein